MRYTRRDLGKVALATLPMAKAFGVAKINSKFGGVQIGAISYSFNRIASPDAAVIIKALVDLGLGEVELTLDHCESLAGIPAAPAGGGRAQSTPEQQAASAEAHAKIAAWRAAATPATWAPVRKRFEDAGVDVALLSGEMNDRMTDKDIEYQFSMARGVGVKALNTSTTLTMAKRIAPIADKHKLRVGYHGHDQTNDPNQTATIESYDTLMAYGKFNGVNLDIGHFTAANYDAVAFIQKHHDKITSLHLKDRKKDHGPNVPWGTGDTPIKEVLLLIKKNKYPIPCNIEWEMAIPQGSDLIAEMKKCKEFCAKCLA
jgi:sugar phosphate isomerase/epimerase